MLTKLTEHRKRNLLTLQQIAQRSGIHPSSLSRYESGRVRPGRARIARLAKAYGLTQAKLERLLAAAQRNREARRDGTNTKPKRGGKQGNRIASQPKRRKRQR